MGCRHGGHGWHDCGPSYGPAYEGGGYGPADWYEQEARPIRRGYRRSSGPDRGPAPEALEARLAELQDEMGRIATELADLRGSTKES